MKSKQDMCPICTEPFKKDEVVIEYEMWGTSSELKFLAHLDCALAVSRAEGRKHPPS